MPQPVERHQRLALGVDEAGLLRRREQMCVGEDSNISPPPARATPARLSRDRRPARDGPCRPLPPSPAANVSPMWTTRARRPFVVLPHRSPGGPRCGLAQVDVGPAEADQISDRLQPAFSGRPEHGLHPEVAGRHEQPDEFRAGEDTPRPELVRIGGGSRRRAAGFVGMIPYSTAELRIVRRTR